MLIFKRLRLFELPGNPRAVVVPSAERSWHLIVTCIVLESFSIVSRNHQILFMPVQVSRGGYRGSSRAHVQAPPFPTNRELHHPPPPPMHTLHEQRNATSTEQQSASLEPLQPQGIEAPQHPTQHPITIAATPDQELLQL